MNMQNDGSPSIKTGSSGITLQGQLLEHFLLAMERLQDDLKIPKSKGQDGSLNDNERYEAFMLQVEYLLHLLPDEDLQDDARDLISDRLKKYTKAGIYPSKRQAEYAANMSVITKIMAFLNSGLDLIHDDIAAPLTQRARTQSEEEDEHAKPSNQLVLAGLVDE
jgi:hypothetical protein